MFQRARNRMTQVIEQNSAERIAKELDAGKLQATLVWNPSGEPRFLLDIRRPTDTKSMLVLVGYKEDSTNEWETILCPIPADAPAIDAAVAVNERAQIGESLWTLRHEKSSGNSKPIHKFRIEFAPLQSTAIYVALESETDSNAGDRMVMHVAETHPNG